MTPKRRTVANVVGVVFSVASGAGAVATDIGGNDPGLVVSVLGLVASVVGALGLVVGLAGGGSRSRGRMRRRAATGRPHSGLRRRTTDERDRMSPRLRTRWPTAALVDRLLDQAARQLPLEADRDRWAEEWADHRRHLRGLRLLWWAWCVRATASRTAGELRHARLPRPDR